MRIDLSSPDAVWQAAKPILAQPNAVAIFAKALSLLPPDDHRGATLHRIRLATCDDKALFTAVGYRPALTVLSIALQRGAKISCLRRLIRRPRRPVAKAKIAAIRGGEAGAMQNKTRTLHCSAGCFSEVYLILFIATNTSK